MTPPPRHPANDTDRTTPRDPLLAGSRTADDSTDEERAPDMPTRHADGSILLPTPAAIFAAADRAADEASEARAAAVRASDHALSCADQVGAMLGELGTLRRHVDGRLGHVESEVRATGDMMRAMSAQQGLAPVHAGPRDRPISYADLEPLLDDREKKKIGARFQRWSDKFAVAIVTGLAGVLVAAVSTALGWGLHELRHPDITPPTTHEAKP